MTYNPYTQDIERDEKLSFLIKYNKYLIMKSN